MSMVFMTLIVGVAGGLGAAIRYLIDLALPKKTEFPAATFLINTVGSFLAGLSVGFVIFSVPAWLAVAFKVGLLGGFTTFSATSLQIAELIDDRRFTMAGFVAGLQLLASVLLAFIGLWISLSLLTHT